MFEFDEIGYWSEIKLEIIKEYASAYSTILNARSNPSFYHIYIDAFSGSGKHISKATGEFILGSPLNALNVKPSFKEYYFIDLDGDKIDFLKTQTESNKNVYFRKGDCNNILINDIFKRCNYKEYKRALCLLDPYGLHLNWTVIAKAAELKSIEIFINFPIMDMNRNVIWSNPEKVKDSNIERLNAFWGDTSWRDIAYVETPTLFGSDTIKAENKEIADAFKKRLSNIAGYKYVAEPMPMRNSRGSIIYYLFFASQKPVSEKIVTAIFKKYKNKGFK